jgi:C4-type Zn-finger protein
MAKEVQVTCPQCGGNDAYIETEQSDYTAPASTWIYHKKWICSHCGWPDTVWTKFGSYTTNENPQYSIDVTITDSEGKEIKLPKENAK